MSDNTLNNQITVKVQYQTKSGEDFQYVEIDNSQSTDDILMSAQQEFYNLVKADSHHRVKFVLTAPKVMQSLLLPMKIALQEFADLILSKHSKVYDVSERDYNAKDGRPFATLELGNSSFAYINPNTGSDIIGNFLEHLKKSK